MAAQRVIHMTRFFSAHGTRVLGVDTWLSYSRTLAARTRTAFLTTHTLLPPPGSLSLFNIYNVCMVMTDLICIDFLAPPFLFYLRHE